MRALKIIILLFAVTLLFASEQQSDLVVIVNVENTSAINQKTLYRILKGENTKWPSGTAVKISLMKTTTPIGEETSKTYYKMSGNSLNKYWLSLVFQGKAKAPEFFNNEDDVISFVSNNKGAVGIVKTTDFKGKNVKILSLSAN